MKHNFKTIALFVGLSMLAVGCQKENYVEQSISDVEQQHYAKVRYTIDGVTMTATFNDEMSWQAFLHWIFALAEEGHRVSFCKGNCSHGITKETVIYTTKSRTDAEKWADNMSDAGYEVSIDFDEKTKTYTCVAIK